MKLKKWTIKQIMFEREMNHTDHSIRFNGFKLPKEKDFLLAVLEELYEHYGDNDRETNLKDLNKYLKNGVHHIEICVSGKFSMKCPYNSIRLDVNGKFYYPYENKLNFTSSNYCMYSTVNNWLLEKYIIAGYNIHKHCLVNPLTGR